LDISSPNGVYLRSSDLTGAVIEVVAAEYEIIRQTSPAGDLGQIHIPGFADSAAPGNLQLPMKGILLDVPPGVSIELRIVEDDIEEVQAQIDLTGSPVPARLSEDLTAGEMRSSSGGADRWDPGWSPKSPVKIAEEAWVRDQRMIRLEIYPFQYGPEESTLLWHKRMLVRLDFVPETNQGKPDAPLSRSGSLQWAADLEQSTSGPRYKITVSEDGIYELTYAELQAAGLDVGAVDPRKFQLSNQGRDVAIHVAGEGDGSFDSGDAIKFYGTKFYGDYLAQQYAVEASHWMTYTGQLADGSYGAWHPEFTATMMEKYTDENVYWLVVGQSNGLRMPLVSGAPGDLATTPAYYTDTVQAEQSHEWYTHNFTSEDTWFWDRIRTEATRTYTATLSSIAAVPSNAIVRAELVARMTSSNSPDHHTRFYLNDDPAPIDDQYWHGISRYRFETEVPLSSLVEGENQLKMSVLFDAYANQVTDDIYFDWFEIEYARLFEAVNNQLKFSRNEGDSAWKYEIGGFTESEVEVLDITDPWAPRIITGSELNSGKLVYESSHAGQAVYYIFGNSAIQKPVKIQSRPASNLKSSGASADYIFIAHQDFIAETQTLADYRSSQGLTTLVVDIQDVYDEFNAGIINPIAIKNFLAYAFANWDEPPTYVLLVGDGHWNPKGYQSNSPSVDYSSPTPVYIPPNLSWVDPWQGEVDSANLLAAVAGDDPLPDVHIGRLPVNSVAELEAVINKIIAYENSPFEAWQYHIMFVADNNDTGGKFSNLAEGIINSSVPSGFVVERLYLDDYQGQADPKESINQDIIQGLNAGGASLLNYIGHGSINRWAAEGIFTNSDISELSNGAHLPVLISMDCLDGYWLYPGTTGLVEELLRAENKGIVSSFSPTGLGVATGHDALHSGFYQAVFEDNVRVLGPATMAGKLALYATGKNYDLLHTFSIFGDPALEMKIPASPVYLPIITRPGP